MFGMVLVVGIVVDDAIVVVENVERIMSEEGLPPREATRKAMGQISGAIVGVTVVLISVFVPLAFFTGAVGNIYRQFSVVMASSIAFSAFLALSLTPALCATLLKPVEAGHHHAKRGFFGWFNRGFSATAKGYEGLLGAHAEAQRAHDGGLRWRSSRGVIWLVLRLPTSFLPNEDQGYIIVNVQLPPGATANRALAVMEQVEGFMLKQPEVKSMVSVLGFSFSGQGQNAALAFVTLKDWDERDGPEQSAQALAGRTFGAMMGVKDAFIFALSPPPIPELGNATGFNFRLQDRGGNGHDALVAARNQLLGMAAQSKLLAGVRPDGLEDAPQLRIDIDRDKAGALGVGFDAINAVISTAFGSTYVNDFPSQGRLQRVVVQADAPTRMQPDDILQLNAHQQPRPAGAAVGLRHARAGSPGRCSDPLQRLSDDAHRRRRRARRQHRRGDGRDGAAGGAAAAGLRLRMDRPVARGDGWPAPPRCTCSASRCWRCSCAWRRCTRAGRSRSSVLLVVPLGVLGVVLGTELRGCSNDVYFKIGLITIIGLSAKNAVLIIEFAKDLQAQGKSAGARRCCEAAHLRFRPIVMTSMAFMLGVLPLAIATGAGSASQRSIGTGVMGGMISAVAAVGAVRAGVLRRRAALVQGQRAPAQAVCARARRRRACGRDGGPVMSTRRDDAAPSALLALLLAGCASMAPPYERPAAPVAATFPDAAAPPAAPPPRAGRRHRMAAVLHRPAAEAADRAGAAEQPRPAHRRC